MNSIVCAIVLERKRTGPLRRDRNLTFESREAYLLRLREHANLVNATVSPPECPRMACDKLVSFLAAGTEAILDCSSTDHSCVISRPAPSAHIHLSYPGHRPPRGDT